MYTATASDFLARLHHLRSADFRKGKHLGKGDHMVVWTRPQRPDWMDVATYERMPKTIEVREIKVDVDQPGFRVDSFVVVTTLVDAKKYSKADLADLYRKRWLVELDIRAIKCTMGMDVMRCKTPEMVRREIWTCLLAYNLTRKAMLEAAHQHGRNPRQLSFTAAMQKIAAGYTTLLLAGKAIVAKLIETQLTDLAGQEVGDRPDRAEPRAVKRRPKVVALLTKPRDEARAELPARIR